jgi:hypothetical protein
VSEAIEAIRGGLLRGWNDREQSGAVAILRLSPGSAEDALPLLPHHREVVVLVAADFRERVQ